MIPQQSAHGVLTCESFGCEYDPTGTRQNDSFTYTVSDGYGGTDTGAVTLIARNVTLTDDAAATPATKDKVVNVLANDTGVLASDRVDVNAVSGGADAEVQPDRTVMFRAPSAGTYTFTYELYTADFDSLGSATATITVSPAPPISANVDVDDTAMGAPVTISVGRNDVINPANFPLDNADSKVLAAPAHGTAVVDFEPERYGNPQRLRNLPGDHLHAGAALEGHRHIHLPDQGQRGERGQHHGDGDGRDTRSGLRLHR